MTNQLTNYTQNYIMFNH